MYFSSPKECSKSSDFVCLGIIAGVFLFFIFTIRAGQPWPDDFAMYLHESENIVHHTSLGNTGYIYDPYNPGLGPRLYPPLFPVLLAPAYAIGGIANLEPMKIEIILFFGGLLFVLWARLGSALPSMSRVALLAIVGFSPVLWNYKDLIASDIPFAFFLYVTLALAESVATQTSRTKPRQISGIICLSVLLYLCYGTRTIGIVLIPSLLLVALLYWRRNGPSLSIAAGCGLALCILQAKAFAGEASYFDQLRLGPSAFLHAVVANMATYSWSLATFWSTPYSHAIRNGIFVVASLLALVSYLKRVRLGPGIYEVFVPAYLAVVLIWPNPDGVRYLIPLFPLYVFCLLDGADAVAKRFQIRRPQLAAAGILLIIALVYATEFAHVQYGPFREGVENPQAQELFAFIRTETKPGDVFVFRRPRALALYTDRNASIYPEPKYAARFAAYFQSIAATYVIEAPALDDADFDSFVEKTYSAKQPVFSNSDFRVYRIGAADSASYSPRLAQSSAP